MLVCLVWPSLSHKFPPCLCIKRLVGRSRNCCCRCCWKLDLWEGPVSSQSAENLLGCLVHNLTSQMCTAILHAPKINWNLNTMIQQKILWRRPGFPDGLVSMETITTTAKYPGNQMWSGMTGVMQARWWFWFFRIYLLFQAEVSRAANFEEELKCVLCFSKTEEKL